MRDWFPGRRERCGSRGSRTSRLWRSSAKRSGDLSTEDVRRLRQLETENARLKKPVAERDLEIEVIREVAAKNW